MEQSDITANNFAAFEELVDEYCADNRAAVLPDNAAVIQKMFKRNKKKAVRVITKQQGSRCSVEPATIFNHFSTSWIASTSDADYYTQSNDERVEVFDRPFTLGEVSRKLKAADNTSPGPDRITCHHCRKTENSIKTLTSILNLCILFRKDPDSWKKSMTILLSKSGDPLDLKKWRPIALSNTIYKLFAKTQILAKDTRTDYIDVRRGVKQGCPLSGILFNLPIDPTLRRIQGNASDHRILAFADDIALLAHSPEDLQSMHDLVHDDLKKINL
ncbi:hypothetical protein AVEN_14020-1 [Araneus ventricosus]|uniref:Reverse transcriptase domain-containing protein n=1 Tax=Araneus ventricosus TaxID=182803 RepID=A0A4Y2N3T5_ARAVE|nr:hypothetical protein AVEN_14020-1 [Araneus ventricosus]